MILHLGVFDVPYVQPPPTGPRPAKVTSGTQTTGDVATWLEAKYHVMEVFYEAHQAEVVGAVERSLQDAVENLLLGAPSHTVQPFSAGALTDIGHSFKKFLSSGEIEGLGVTGVPTQAALDRRSLRFKKKTAQADRPSFIDTGLYQSSFTAWVD